MPRSPSPLVLVWLVFGLNLVCALGTALYIGCAGGQLTVTEASEQVDVACLALARVLAHDSTNKAERLRAQLCNSERTVELMARVLAKLESDEDAGADFLIETYPLDAAPSIAPPATSDLTPERIPLP